MAKRSFWIGALIVIAVIVTLVGTYRNESDCSDAGGVRLRPVFGVWQCYDKSSLREVNPEVPRG